MKNYFTILSLMFHAIISFSQDGIQLNTPAATQGYSLYTYTTNTFLVDNCGKIVKTWNVSLQSGTHCKLLPDGNLLYINSSTIFERDWNGNLVKSIPLVASELKLSYEVIKLKNGNYLCVARESVTLAKFQEYGYDIPFTFPSQSDSVVEVDGSTGLVVWRWNIFDHVIQDKFSAKKAFGVIKDNPGKIDINAIATVDWNSVESFMINGMDYNEELDQIVLSVRKVGEIVIIDHSTTTEQAKGSAGGRYGKGGDFLYRYGNPANYDRGSTADRQLYFQHNPNWIQHGPHKGKIILFNNLLSKENYSTVQIIDPLKNANGTYPIESNKPFMPLSPTVEYGKTPNKVSFQSSYTSGAKVLPNQNIIITEGRTGTLYEINPSGDVVWKYDAVKSSGHLFRTERYSYDYPAFIGKDLQPDGTVEFPSSTYSCQLYTDTEDASFENNYIIKQYSNVLAIQSDDSFELSIFNIEGKLLSNQNSINNQVEWNHGLSNQIVFLQIKMGKNIVSKKVFLN